MSQTLIDQISRAVYAKGLEPPPREVLVAVIEAMREPTENMMVTWENAEMEDGIHTDHDKCRFFWQVMIAAALREQIHAPNPSTS